MSEAHRNKLIKSYFYKGYSYQTITEFLYVQDGIRVSVRHLKRILKSLGLRRRVPLNMTILQAVTEAISKELQGSGSLLGYRQMWRRVVRKYKLPISREMVRKLLQFMAPEETQQRRAHRLSRRVYHAKGPNHIWHADGFDKLKPYGFPIHGCIDGYSRKILWLKVGTTNSKPSVIARYFIDSVLQVKGVPSVLRCDLGTENTHLAWIQPFLRQYHTDSLSSAQACFRYGRSVSNQRIEAWWSILKKWNAGWWMALFKGLQIKGLLDETDPLQLKCLRLAFMDILQKELDQISVEWNSHYVRKQRNLSSPCGIPEKLYHLPELYGARNQIKCVRLREVHYIRDRYTEEPPTPADVEFLRLARRVMIEHNMDLPKHTEEAIKFYINLWTILENECDSIGI